MVGQDGLRVKNGILGNVTEKTIARYRECLLWEKRLSQAAVKRKLTTLKRFFSFLLKKGLTSQDPFTKVPKQEIAPHTLAHLLGVAKKSLPPLEEKVSSPILAKLGVKRPSFLTHWLEKLKEKHILGEKPAQLPANFSSWPWYWQLLYHVRHTRPSWYYHYHQFTLSHYLHFGFFVIILSAFGFSIYDQFTKQVAMPLAHLESAILPANQVFTFGGRLTDKLAKPVIGPTKVSFRLWNKAIGGHLLYESGECLIDPDQNGFFTTIIGQQCGTPMAATVFSSQANVYLGITVANDEEMQPRHQMPTVAYALNAATLAGYPPSASASAGQIPVISQNGDLVIAVPNPRLLSTSGTFQLRGQAVNVVTDTGTSGDVTIAPDGTGSLNLVFGGVSNKQINATAANLGTGGVLYYGAVANDDGFCTLMQLQSGEPTYSFVRLVDRFLIDCQGNSQIGGKLQVAGDLSQSIDYSRLGKKGSSHELKNAQDLMLSGKLEVNESAFFDENIVLAGKLAIGGSNAGNKLHVYTNDTSDVTANDGSMLILEQNSGGDAGVQFELTGGQIFSLGIDNSTTRDDFVIFDGNSPRLSIDGSSGNITIAKTLLLSSSLELLRGGITLENDETIANSIDSEIVLSNGVNSLTFDFSKNSSSSIDVTSNGSTNLTFNPGGNVGIGTTNPLWKLQVSHQAATASALIENTANVGTADPTALILRLGSDTTNPSAADRFINFLRGDSTIIGKIQGNGSQGVTYATTGVDFAEYFTKEEDASFSEGDLACIGKEGRVRQCQQLTNWLPAAPLLGIVSTHPGFAAGKEGADKVLVALVGQVETKVSLENGPIRPGDPLTISTLAGIARKGIKAGTMVGRALEEFDPVNGKGEIIVCGESSLEVACGKILVLVNVSWYDPDVYLTDSGDLEITKVSSQPTVLTDTEGDETGNYGVKVKTREIVDRVGAFSEAAVTNLRTGIIDTKELLVEGTTAITGILTANIITSKEFVADTAKLTSAFINEATVEQLESERIFSPLVETADIQATGTAKLAQVETVLIRPIPDGDDTVSGTLAAKDVHSGNLQSLSVYTESLGTRSATISGTLYADKIESEELLSLKNSFGDLLGKVDSLASNSAPLAFNQKTASDKADLGESNVVEHSAPQTIPPLAQESVSVKCQTGSGPKGNCTPELLFEWQNPHYARPTPTPAYREEETTLSAKLIKEAATWSIGPPEDDLPLPPPFTLGEPWLPPSTSPCTVRCGASLGIKPTTAEVSSPWTIGTDIVAANGLTVLGQASLGETYIHGPLLVSGIAVEDSTINSFQQTLKIQDTASFPIEIMGGKIAIDTKGNVTIKGDLIARGGITTGLIRPIPDGDVVIDLGLKSKVAANNGFSTPEVESGNGTARTAFGNLLVRGIEGKEVASIDAAGNASFAGSLIASRLQTKAIDSNQLAVEQLKIKSATTSGFIIAAAQVASASGIMAPGIKTNATTGQAILPAGEKELVIFTPYVGENSFVYLTPLSPTNNQVLYVAGKKRASCSRAGDTKLKAGQEGLGNLHSTDLSPDSCSDGFILVAVEAPIDHDVKFNWWIIN